jgi:hypothetical protein
VIQQRRKVAIALGTLVVVGLGGLGLVQLVSAHSNSSGAVGRPQPTKCEDTYKVLNLRPSQVAAATAVCLAQSLQLSGELSGAVAQAFPVEPSTATPTQMCAVPRRWDSFPKARLAFVANKKAYRLLISPSGSSQHQPVTTNNVGGVVELTSMADPKTTWNQASGAVKVNPDGITGTIDVSLLRDVSGAKPVHVTGQWACGAPLLLPTFDSSAPCSSFYALNRLQDADLARMKAQACNAVDLTFSGDVSAHLDHAVTDTAISAGWIGIGDDNACGAIGRNYVATLKFSLGDETFDLTLRANEYPAVSPGRYPAGGGLSTNGSLVLGHADPDRKGIFVEDGKIFWLGSGGSFTIADDMKSGTIDETYTATRIGQPSSVHVAGSWRCSA